MSTYRLIFFFFFNFIYDIRLSLYSHKKLKLIFVLLLYITVVSLMSYDGPDEALMYFVLILPVWRSGQRAGLITLRSGVRITSPVFYNSCVLKKHIVKA